MNAEIFAEWMSAQGYTILKSEDCYWVNQGPRTYQAFPYYWRINPDLQDLREFIKKNKILCLRFSSDISSPNGACSYHVVTSNKQDPLEPLSKHARHDVEKGKRSSEIRQIPLSRLANEGWQLRKDTLERQGRSEAESQEWWRRMCKSTEGLPGFEAWAAICEGRLAASLLAFTCEDTCSILYQQSLSEFLRHGVNNALTYEFTQTALSRPNISSIFYGLHSLDAPASVDAFKFRMGYEAKPVRQRVVFHPMIAPLVNETTHAVVKIIHQARPGSRTFAKAEGMLRFYLQGKMPLEEQTWPEALAGRKEEILAALSSPMK